MSQKKTLLLTNDDGVHAEGLRSFHKALRDHYEIIVAAPHSDVTGVAHAVTLLAPLRYEPLPVESELKGYRIFGTPADCVKISLGHILKEKPDLVVSGMNIGENTGVSVFYSGTVAAAREGAFQGIPSFAFSVSEKTPNHVDEYCRRAVDLLGEMLQLLRNESTGSRNFTYYNINFPSCPPQSCRGVKVARQSFANYDDGYECRTDSNGAESLWLAGEKRGIEPSLEFDTRALFEGYATVTPLDMDTTAQNGFDALSKLEGR